MNLDISQNFAKFETEDTRQFTLAMTTAFPNTVDFTIYGFGGEILPRADVQSGASVQESGNPGFSGSSRSGIYFINYVLPVTPGMYNGRWTAWDSASRTYTTPIEFEVVATMPYSYFSYGNQMDITRSARQLFARSNITPRDIQPYQQSADGYIDAFLGRVMTVPLGSASPLLADMCKVYTLWRFYCDQYSYDTKQEPPAIIHRKEDYDKLLALIAAGSLNLPGILPLVSFDPVAIPSGHKPVFDMRDFTDQNVSDSLLREEADRDLGD